VTPECPALLYAEGFAPNPILVPCLRVLVLPITLVGIVWGTLALTI
jgi:hypothetical protein